MHTCNPRTQGVEVGGSEVQGRPWASREFKVRTRNTVTIFFKVINNSK